MKSVLVAVPVQKEKVRLTVDKGRPWSIIEHLLLEGLVRESRSISNLAEAACLPRRVVIEAIVRLMRAGWVQLSQTGDAIQFSATPHGIAVASAPELPNIAKRVARPTSFLFDKITGSVFRNRELILATEKELKEMQSNEDVVVMEPDSIVSYDSSDFVKVLLEEDEKFVAADSQGLRPYARFALVRVRNGSIVDGLPDRAVAVLRRKILALTASSSEALPLPLNQGAVPIDPSELGEFAEDRPLNFAPKDLILGGEAHLQVLQGILESASSRVIIHSTFIAFEKVVELLPLFAKAVRRGVRIDVLWGQDEDKDKSQIVATRDAITKLQQNDLIKQMTGSLVFQPFSTKSHAKIVVADNKDGSFLAVVGSCNWLSSGFHSYEASIVVRDTAIVADVVSKLADVAFYHSWEWSDLRNELLGLSGRLRDIPTKGATKGRAVVVSGAQHNQFMLRARDEARKQIYVMSHRLGASATPSVITPMSAAVANNGIQAHIFFSRTTYPVPQRAKGEIIESAASQGVKAEPIQMPRLHAKVLGWDNDCVVITSLNWLSADPMSSSDPKEVGIWIQAPGIARQLLTHFQSARAAGQLDE